MARQGGIVATENPLGQSCRVHRSLLGRVTVLELARSGAPHVHSQPHLLLKLEGADGCFEVGGRPYAFSSSRAVLVNCWQPHAYRHAAGARFTRVLAIYLEAPAGPDGATRENPLRFPQNGVAVTSRMREAAAAVVDELDRPAQCDAVKVDAALHALLEGARVEVREAATSSGAPLDPATLDRRVARCMDYMREHLDARDDLGDVGARFGLSRPHLFHLFRRSTQLTPAMYWNALRMEFAVSSLARRETSVGRLAQDLGFAEQSGFTRFFHAIQGVAPRDYRTAALGTQ